MNFRMSLLSTPDNMSNTGNMSNSSKPNKLGNLNNMGKLSNLSKPSKPSKPDIIICGLFCEITLSLKETAYINRAAQAIILSKRAIHSFGVRCLPDFRGRVKSE